MSSEERWANRQEWKQEKGEIEIKREYKIKTYFPCSVCTFKKAEWQIVIGRTNKDDSQVYWLCDDHKEDIFQLYRDEFEILKEKEKK